ncbi:MAG: 2-dehydropantoate 2-reductase [Pseudomonadota bacterium]
MTLIDPWPEHIEAIRRNGLEITGVTEAERCVAQVPTLHLTEVQSLSKHRPVDIAFVSVKSYDTEWATLLIAPYLAPDGYVVSLQNCINEPRIAALVGWGKTVGCIAALLSAELHAPGRIRRQAARGGGADPPSGVPGRRGPWPHHRALDRAGGDDRHGRYGRPDQ